uniref:Pentatricopeptide repeat-containing protein At4g02750-like n=2 Tax=Nicotiana TaxID=4085 RepID=A0A1S4D8A5_TOBAC|nr:PREDICTED: pentatricopeptide repeat-containing protein At4g02750-like [Nicotiana sylvestris]XP_016509601.1 PREDICTED: pentatricopeptide repeat-containing protein At4g02750-like [Nicotiana tabacum]
MPELRTFAVCRQISTLSTINLNKTINSFIANGNLKEARKLFDQSPHLRNVVSWNSIIAGYFRYSCIQQAEYLFDEMPHRDVVSWNTMLSGYRNANNPEKVYNCFLHMNRYGGRPNELTFAVAISSFLHKDFKHLVPQLHGLVLSLGISLNVFVGSALMRVYIDLNDYKGLARVFDEILVKDVTPWNVLILGYMKFGCTSEAQRAFDMMPMRNTFTWSTLINGYIENNKLNEARSLFDKMSEKDVVSWTAMIRGYVQYGNFMEALKLFKVMLSSGARPNHFTFSTVLDACAGNSAVLVGNQVHACILKSGFPLDVVLLTSLVDMYAKCGDIDIAFCIFESIPERNLVAWNSIIGGYARHGLPERAMQEFERMVKSGIRPDEITFINLVYACGHGGLVEEGERIFNSMVTDYSLKAEMEHYACMVDLYGKAGQLEKAERLIEGMPFKPDVVVWGALLGACGLHSCLELGEIAANGIYTLENDHPAVYSVLSKIYGDKGVCSDITGLEKLMKNWRARKQKAEQKNHAEQCSKANTWSTQVGLKLPTINGENHSEKTSLRTAETNIEKKDNRATR